jgi:NAD(P)-dependent dehydrogenase (short-subunit alcohol dehydrogenase family)
MQSPASPVVLLTGCSTGIGRALALAFRDAGCQVYATARRPEVLQDVTGDSLVALPLDVTDVASIKEAVDTVIADQGRVDLLVNNAGLGLFWPIAEVPLERVRRLMETNTLGALATAQAVIPHMIKAKSGHIVNVGSVSGILTTPFAGAYCASKAALHALSEAMDLELEPFGIHVTTLQPGAVKTALSDNSAEAFDDMDWEGSAYGALKDDIIERSRTAANSDVSAEDFARETVAALLTNPPPRVHRLGTHSAQAVWYRRLIPPKLLQRVLRKKYGLARLAGKP